MPVAPDDPRLAKCGFAKLQGEGIEYYINKYEVVLGRTSKSSALDVSLGDNMNISRQHAVIKYNFETKSFELSAMGKNGVSVNGTLYTPVSPPQPLQSQDLLQVGTKAFHFLLPKAPTTKRPAGASGEGSSKKPKLPAQGQAAQLAPEMQQASSQGLLLPGQRPPAVTPAASSAPSVPVSGGQPLASHMALNLAPQPGLVKESGEFSGANNSGENGDNDGDQDQVEDREDQEEEEEEDDDEQDDEDDDDDESDGIDDDDDEDEDGQPQEDLLMPNRGYPIASFPAGAGSFQNGYGPNGGFGM